MMATTDLGRSPTPSTGRSPSGSGTTPTEFADAFARAWYKLLHRDMGPVSRFLGPVGRRSRSCGRTRSPPVEDELIGDADVADLKAKVLDSGLSVAQLVCTAWASAASYRDTDKRGGANGARIRLAPQKDWEVNDPSDLGGSCSTLEEHPAGFNGAGGKQCRLADLIVLGGVRRRREGGQGRGPRRHRPVLAGAHRRHAGADRRRVLRGARAQGRRVPQLHPSRATSCRPSSGCSTRRTCCR